MSELVWKRSPRGDRMSVRHAGYEVYATKAEALGEPGSGWRVMICKDAERIEFITSIGAPSEDAVEAAFLAWLEGPRLSTAKPYVPPSAGIALADCVRGRLYQFRAQNFKLGVFDGVHGFIGIRDKHDMLRLDTEDHSDRGPPHGSVWGIVDTGIDCPEIDLSLGNRALFAFLESHGG